jgi:hypothetical protein
LVWLARPYLENGAHDDDAVKAENIDIIENQCGRTRHQPSLESSLAISPLPLMVF